MRLPSASVPPHAAPATLRRARRASPHAARPRAARAVLGLVGAALAAGCARGDARTADASPAANADAPIGAGDYVVRSAARHQGRTLVILDAPNGRHGAQLRAPGKPDELYSGAVTVRPDGNVDVALVCDCPVGRDAAGSVRHDAVTYDGRYAPRALGGGRVELRQLDGTAVDTLERVR